MKKLLLKAIGLVLLLVLAGLAFAAWKVRSLVTEDELVRVIEENLNCRAHVGGLEVSLSGARVGVTLREVRLGRRDGEVGKPLAERAAMGDAPVEIESVRMEVDLGGAFAKRLEVREFVFVAPRVKLTLLGEGGSSLDELLRSPGERPYREGTLPSPSGREGSGETLNVSQLGLLATLRGVAISHGFVDVTIEKTGLVLSVQNFDASLRDLDVDPANLTGLATAVDFTGSLKIDPAGGQGGSYGTLVLRGPVETRFFDPVTGDLALIADADFALAEESHLSTDIPVLQKAWGTLRKLDQVGIKIGPLPEKGTFGRSKSLAVHYEAGRVSVTKPVSLWLDDWELAVRKGMWIQTEEVQHRAEAELMASQKLSAKLQGKLGEGLDYLPREVRPDAIAAFEKSWFRDGRLYAHVESEGDLSDPDLDLVNKPPDFEELGRKALERFATDKLKDLFGR